MHRDEPKLRCSFKGTFRLEDAKRAVGQLLVSVATICELHYLGVSLGEDHSPLIDSD